MLNYLPNLATVLLALMQLAKDWGAHQSTWRRALVLVAIMLLGAGGAVNAFFSSRKAAAQHIADEKEISASKKAVETASADQQANTKIFMTLFNDLSHRAQTQGRQMSRMEKSEATFSETIAAVARQVDRFNAGHTSSGALRRVTSNLTSELRDFQDEWLFATHNVELFDDEFFYYHQPSSPQDAEEKHKKIAEMFAIANREKRQELASLLHAAESLRASMSAILTPENRIPDDAKEQKEIDDISRQM